MSDHSSKHSPVGPAASATGSHAQDAPADTADVAPAPATSPVSTGPPERPPVHPQHPSSGTWRAVRTAGAPLSVREVEAAASGAPTNSSNLLRRQICDAYGPLFRFLAPW